MSQKGNYISLALKNAVVYIFLILTSTLILGLIVYRLSSGLILNASSQQVKHNTELIDMKFNSYVENIRRDINFLSNNPYITQFLYQQNTTNDPQLKNKLSREFLELLKSNPEYNQVRLIGVEDSGREIIRVDRIGNETEIVDDIKLQQKGDRNYFLETKKMQKNMVYFSPIDLNKEYGKISTPYMPTLRAAAPLYIRDEFQGIVVINADLRNFFKELKKTAGNDNDLYLVNDEGYYLIHPDSQKVFGFEFNRNPEIEQFIPTFIEKREYLANQKNIEISFGQKKLYLDIKNVNYPRSNYDIYAILASDTAKVLSPFIKWRGQLFISSLLIIAVFLSMAWWWMRKQSQELKDIIGSMVSFSKDYQTTELKIHSNDEIGELAESFKEMATTIRGNVQELEQAKLVAQKANKEKEEFLENMSHEIRNPLHGIIGMSRMLEQNSPRADQSSFIQSLQFNTKQLLSLVNDILDFSKIRIGQIELHKENLLLFPLLDQIIKSHNFFALSKKIKLVFDIDEKIKNDVINTDPLRLSQILNNLITNAIKFTNEHGQVSVHVGRTEKDKLYIYNIEVIDTGVGMTESEIDKIFTRYHSKNNAQVELGQEGMGLGLAIVTQLLNLFDSTLHVSSTIGKGSNFSFELIQEQQGTQKDEKVVVDNLMALPEVCQSILCLDDDPQQLFLFEHIFKDRKLVCLASFNQLHELNTNEIFDLIITDWRIEDHILPEHLHELELHIKSNGKIVVLSGSSTIQEECEHYGSIDLCLLKPIEPNNLIKQIAALNHKNYSASPDFSALINDYDADAQKISSALEILSKEWKQMKENLVFSLKNKDKTLYDAVFHKLITTLRRFGLTEFKLELEKCEDLFLKTEAIPEALIQQINNTFEYCEQEFNKALVEWKSRI